MRAPDLNLLGDECTVPKLGYLVEWESHASWICLPNGLGSAIFLAFLRGKRIRTESLQPIISVSGNGILRLGHFEK